MRRRQLPPSTTAGVSYTALSSHCLVRVVFLWPRPRGAGTHDMPGSWMAMGGVSLPRNRALRYNETATQCFLSRVAKLFSTASVSLNFYLFIFCFFMRVLAMHTTHHWTLFKGEMSRLIPWVTPLFSELHRTRQRWYWWGLRSRYSNIYCNSVQ